MATDINIAFEAVSATNNSAAYSGGVLCNSAGSTLLSKCFFDNNNAGYYGGVLCNLNDAFVSDTDFSRNTAVSRHGGAVCVSSGLISISGGTYTSNTAGNHGGAVFVANSGANSIRSASFTGNQAAMGGGAVNAMVGSLEIDHATLTENTAGTAGGAVWISGTLNGNGTFTNNSAGTEGGAIYNYTAATLTGSFSGNYAGSNGGAVYNKGTLTMSSGSIMSANSAGLHGGAIFHIGQDLTIAAMSFSGNSAGYNGGAIADYGTGVTALAGGMVFNGNIADYFGGAIFKTAGTLALENGTFTSNTAVSRHGGAVCVSSGLISISGGTYTSNTAGNHGGAVFVANSGANSIRSASFTGNQAAMGGGAVNAMVGSLEIDHVTLTGNTAGAAGGAVWISGTLNGNGTFTNNKAGAAGGALCISGTSLNATGTFMGNSAGTDGGAIYNYTSATMTGTFSGNFAGSNGGAIYNKGTLTLSSGSIISANSAGLHGGAIYHSGQDLTIAAMSFSGNSTGHDGGAIADYGTGITTLAGGMVFSGNTGGYFGGAIFNAGGSMNTSNVVFNANKSVLRHGGAVYNTSSGTVSMANAELKGNSAALYGGAIYNDSGASLYLSSGTFLSNSCSNAGGAVYNYGVWVQNGGAYSSNIANDAAGAFQNQGSAELNGVTFSENETSLIGGGAICNRSGELLLNSCVFTDNKINVGSGDGGAIYSYEEASLVVSDTEFSSNFIVSGAGAGVTAFGSAVFTNVVFRGNSAMKAGGGLFINGDTTLTHVEFDANSVSCEEDDLLFDNPDIAGGGALFVHAGGVLKGTDVQFLNSYAEWGGGAIMVWSGSIDLTSASFIGNTGGNKLGQGASSYKGEGGAVHLSCGSLTLDSAMFLSNTAHDIGGGIFADQTHVRLSNIQISSCTGEYGAGAACFWGGDVVISNALIKGNNTTSGIAGGIAMLNGGTMKIYHASFEDNYTGIKHANGGALWFNNNATMKDVDFSNNSTMQNGGALFTSSSIFKITSGNYVSNTASSGGGAIFMDQARGEIDKLNFVGNYTSLTGGAVEIAGGSVNLTSVSFDGNRTLYSGGALLNRNSASTLLSEAVFSGNTVDYYGGAICNNNATMIISGGLFMDNTAMTRPGGAIYNDNAVMIISGGLIQANKAMAGHGGAVFNCNSGIMTLSDVVFSDNEVVDTGYNGGAIYNYSATISLKDCEFQSLKDTVYNDAGILNLAGVNTFAGEVKCHGSNTLNLDVSKKSTEEGAIINDWSFVNTANSTNITITVAEKPFSGVYKLAENASSFNRNVTIVNTLGISLGNLTVGSSFVYDNETYELNRDGNGLLSITIMSATPAELHGDANGLSWTPITDASGYIVEYSKDDFAHSIQINTATTQLDSYSLPKGSYQWRVRAVEDNDWRTGPVIMSADNTETAILYQSDADSDFDCFFAQAKGTWSQMYQAQHVGIKGGWDGTKESINLQGKNIIADVLKGSADANVLVLTDDANGDALFVDDIYTAFPDSITESQARIAQIDEIRAGAGDDIVDATSQRFDYIGGGIRIYGGDGNDVIWANIGSNMLFGDDGDDRLVGASGNDFLIGGAGNDSMHGGGGNDAFCFCDAWGTDEVQQLAGGTVVLWFSSGSLDNWNAATMTYSDGANSVVVSGIDSGNVSLRFGNDGSAEYGMLAATDAFKPFASKRVYEEEEEGILAGL